MKKELPEKIDVSKNAVGLWSLILSGPVMAPEWEIQKSADIRELIEVGLIKVSGNYPGKFLQLVCPELGFTDQEKIVFQMIKAGNSPVDAAVLIAWAKEAGIDRPLLAMKRLIYLGVVEVCDKRVLQAR